MISAHACWMFYHFFIVACPPLRLSFSLNFLIFLILYVHLLSPSLLLPMFSDNNSNENCHIKYTINENKHRSTQHKCINKQNCHKTDSPGCIDCSMVNSEAIAFSSSLHFRTHFHNGHSCSSALTHLISFSLSICQSFSRKFFSFIFTECDPYLAGMPFYIVRVHPLVFIFNCLCHAGRLYECVCVLYIRCIIFIFHFLSSKALN